MLSPLTGTGAAIAQPETHTAIAQFKPYSRSLLPKRGETPVISCGQQQPLPQRGKGCSNSHQTNAFNLLTNRFPSERVNQPLHFRVARTETQALPRRYGCKFSLTVLSKSHGSHEKKVSQPQSGGKKRMSRRTPTCTCKV